MGAFLWEVVLVLEPERGTCEGVGLIRTAPALGGAKGKEGRGIHSRRLERRAGARSCRAPEPRLGVGLDCVGASELLRVLKQVMAFCFYKALLAWAGEEDWCGDL